MVGDTGDALRAAHRRAKARHSLEERAALSAVESALLGRGVAPVTVGRYELARRLGEGGCGVVYWARDPELDRNVAIKLLRVDTESRRSDESEARLRREAAATARAPHPNVVQVFDVGRYRLGEALRGAEIPAEGLFVVMELVTGTDLKRWLADTPRTPSEILAVFREAGRGLAAAHGAGLIHRDFKPANVLLGDDHRVKVADFGLARAMGGGAGDSSITNETSDSNLEAALTVTGEVVGTPAYMSPEQHRAGRLDARSDQYSYCAALYGALAGRRPFAGSTAMELMRAKLAGDILPLPHDRAVPRHVVAALRRGLQPDRSARFPTMDALLEALDPPRPSARRRNAVLAVAGGLGLLGAAVAVLGERSDEARCAAGADPTQVWGTQLSDRVEAAIITSGVDHAAQIWEHVDAQMSGAVQRWSDRQAMACVSAAQPGGDAKADDRRLACLAEHRAALQGAAQVLAVADARAVRQAAGLVDALPPLWRCDRQAWLRSVADLPQDVGQRSQIAGLRTRLGQAEALRLLGKQHEALEVAESALAQAEALGYEPVLLEALAVTGRVQVRIPQLDAAREKLERAYFMAEASANLRVAADAATSLIAVALVSGQDGQGTQWQEHAEAAVSALGALDGPLGYRFHASALAFNARALRFDVAIDHGDKALVIAREIWGDGSLATLAPTIELAEIARSQGRRDRARTMLEQVAERAGQVLGGGIPLAAAEDGLARIHARAGDHDTAIRYARSALHRMGEIAGHDSFHVAERQLSLGIVYRSAGRLDEAQRAFESSLEVVMRVLGPDHDSVAALHTHLGRTAWSRGDYADAATHHRRALDVRRRIHARDDASVAISSQDLATNLAELGQFTEALELSRTAIAIRAEVYGEGSALYGLSRGRMAGILIEAGRFVAAEAQAAAAIQIIERARGKGDRKLAFPLQRLGQALEGQRRFIEALAVHRRALELRLRFEHLEHGRANSLGGVGRCLAALGRFEEARSMLEEAVQLRKAGNESPPLIARAERDIGDAYLAAGQPAAAQPHFERARKIRKAMAAVD